MHDITLTVDDDHVAQIHDVADAARAVGMHVSEVLDNIGIICGSAPASCRPALQDLDGVVDVETGRSYRAAPPDSDVQ